MIYFKPTLRIVLATNSSNVPELKKEQIRHASLQYRFQRCSIILALLIAILVNIGYGQPTFTSVNYNFNQSEPATQLLSGDQSKRIISVASNGYGTWAVDNTGHWYLFSDSLANESTSSTAPVPSGIVSTGVIPNMTDNLFRTKVVANLIGQVRFVAVNNANGSGFKIWGFNDQRNLVDANNNPIAATKHIDISYSGIPNSSGSREFINPEKTITYYGDVSIADGGYPERIDAGNCGEIDWRDCFDVACDENFIYIVYESNPQDSLSKVNLLVVDINTGQALDGFPKLVDISVRRPTVACDVRNTSSNGPGCTIAYIWDNRNVESIPFWHVEWDRFRGNSFQTGGGWFINGNNNITGKFIHPTTGQPTDYMFPKHARVVVSSARNSGSVGPVEAIYVLAGGAVENELPDMNSPTVDHLLVYYTDEGQHPARYLDGVLINNHPTPFSGNSSYPVVNSHIRAFANPYDGRTDNLYDEFHCLYMLKLDVEASTFIDRPLFIMRGFQNGKTQPARLTRIPAGTSDTRFVLTRKFTPPSTSVFTGSPDYESNGNPLQTTFYYDGDANQKGLHIFWITKNLDNMSQNLLSYRRDYRFLDEDIEENTLLTYENTIANGTTHWGTNGAKLLANRIMTLWTDPNFGNGLLYKSLTTQIGWQNARLKFIGQETKLDIGETTIPVCCVAIGGDGPVICSPCSTTWAKLIMLPNTEIRFQDLCERTHEQVLSINPASTFEYYGVPSNRGKSNILGAGTVNLAGQGNVGPLPPNADWGSPNIVAPAYLNIHGGATFVVPNSVLFTANKASIDCYFERDISIINPANNNPYNRGLFKHHGTAELSNSYFKSHHDVATAPSTMPVATVLNVLPPLDPATTLLIPIGCSLGSQQWLSENVEYVNTPNSGRAKLLFDGTTENINYRDITFDAGYMKAAEMDIQDPAQNVTVNDLIFTKTKDVAINIQHSLLRTYSPIDITNNTFTFDVQDVSGISISGFKTRRTSSSPLILIDNNTMTSTAAAPSAGVSSTAVVPFGIQILNSDAKVTNNEVSGIGFRTGISLNGVNWGDGTTSFACSNTITGCYGMGLYTNKWFGYSFLNTISECEVGHRHEGDKNGRIHFCTIEDNLGAGIQLRTGNLLLMNRLNDGTYDIKGHNTISHNNSNGNSAQLEVTSYSGKIWLGSELTTDNGGDNNIISTDEYPLFAIGTLATNSAKVLFDYDQLYWAIGSGNGTSQQIVNNDDLFDNILNSVSDDAQSLSFIDPPSSFECGDGIVPTITKKGELLPLDISPERCGELKNKGSGYIHSGQYQKGYDTLRYFIEQCPFALGAPTYFSEISSNAAELIDINKETSENYRAWLKSVLYLNPDSVYYCMDAMEIAKSYLLDDKKSIIYGDEAASVYRFLADSAQCFFMRDFILSEITNLARYNQYELWKDTVTDSIATPFTPGYTTLEALDLTILRGFKNGVSADITKPLQRNPISELRALPNPMKDEVELSYKLTEGALVKIEVYDALGKQMYSLAQGYKPEGENRLHLDTRSWSSGSYYARFTTLGGEVKTIKLIKE